MRELLSLLAIGFTSALFPLVNIEAYISVRAALSGVGPVWLLSLAAALGQMGGKYLWYRLGASSLSWGWVRRKIDKPAELTFYLIPTQRSGDSVYAAWVGVICQGLR